MLTACGRFDFDPLVGSGSMLDGAPADACTFGPWSSPVALTELNSADSEYSPSLTDDGLEIFFASNRPGGLGNFDIYTATRTSPALPFGAPTALTPLNSSLLEDGPALTPDSLTLYYCVSAGTTMDPCTLMRATRASRSSAFGSPQTVTELPDAWGPYPTRDGRELIYTRTGDSLSRATFSSGTLVDAGPLAELNGMPSGFATLTADGLTIYYETRITTTVIEIYGASRPAVGMPFGSPSRIDEIEGGQGYDGDPDISNADRTLTFASNRDNAATDIYAATRSCQ